MELVKWEAAKQAIIEAHSVDEVAKIRDYAEARRYALKQAGEAPGIIRKAEEIKLRAERRAGQILQEMDKNKGAAQPTRSQGSTATLSDLGVSKNESSKWQKIASIPEDKFETYLDVADEITTSGAIKISKELKRDDRKEKTRPELLEDHEYKPELIIDKFQNIDIPQVDHIITDPPYGQKYKQDWIDLAKMAEERLKPSGFLISYYGHNIPEIYEVFTPHLEYYHMFVLLHSGNLASMHKERINCGYKPIWVFQKPPFKSTGNYINDVIKGTGREKGDHDWQQAVDELYPLIENFTEVNDLILDPFAGSGTVGIACRNKNRRSLLIDDHKNT